jgi:hypothetical protein
MHQLGRKFLRRQPSAIPGHPESRGWPADFADLLNDYKIAQGVFGPAGLCRSGSRRDRTM